MLCVAPCWLFGTATAPTGKTDAKPMDKVSEVETALSASDRGLIAEPFFKSSVGSTRFSTFVNTGAKTTCAPGGKP